MTDTIIRLTKAEIIQALLERDGDTCQHPGCGKELDFSIREGKMMPTIDHTYPRSKAIADGWTYEQIWDLDNLTLQHRQCNAKKGDKLYREDGTLPEPKRKFKYRRQKRANRPVICQTCMNGRILDGDVCIDCGHAPLLYTIPFNYVLPAHECPHSGPWSCYSCYLGMVPREPAIVTVLDGSYLEGE